MLHLLFQALFTPSVLRAMSVVPRHLFFEPSRVEDTFDEARIKAAYTYNKAMGATKWSNESSPEVSSLLSNDNIRYFHAYCMASSYNPAGVF